ncbi:MAG: Signal peptidase I [Berkelbacteria bacterium GW2011_GWB1_38_5]|uniref:Signal peptidase I n=1 Tax=Berkelbacteria bacterium GW2011_GWB1_38_5 TaxID=1618336 RepID=A0A0G0KEM7_9BACT|nr:MAG: Signal peptidase I [Berkelbacteria bacterium GW2011_GWB1_38_5]
MDQNSTPVPKLSPAQNFFYGSGCLFELTKWIVVLLVIGTLIHFFVGTLFIVDGLSMEPNFHSGQYILVNRWQYNFGEPARGDVVVLKFPGDPEHKKYIKRIIGLPGEKVQIINGTVYINDQKLNEKYLPNGMLTLPNVNRTLRDDDYFLLGDNRPNSSDSRTWGISPKRYLIGRAAYTIWPLNLKGIILQPSY